MLSPEHWGTDMQRREFITLLGGAAAAWPLAARAQQKAMPVVGFLYAGPEAVDLAAAFRQGLEENGFVEGHNVRIEYRWANAQYDQLPRLAAELVQLQVDVIAPGAPVAALAAKRATTSIPIVFAIGSDPVKDGLVASINSPGGNITGATMFGNLLPAKRTEVLHQFVPNAKVFALLLNPRNANAELETSETQRAAAALGLQLVILDVTNRSELDKAMANITEQHVEAMVIASDTLFYPGEHISEVAAQNHVGTSFAYREQAVAGGLMSYGAKITETWRQQGNYVGRVLKGEKPAELPILQPTKFEFVINLKTAKALGLTVPPTLLATADEVIE
jgi:putative ABC transport system substrate-binding protein